MRPATCSSCSPSSSAAAGILPAAFTIGVLVLLLCSVAAPAARADGKPASVTTALPAVPLGARQLADLAAKGIPVPVAPALAMPATTARILRTVGPPAGLARVVTKDVPAKPRRLPGVSEALGPIPRESWILEALGKRPDFAVAGGRLVKLEAAGAPR